MISPDLNPTAAARPAAPSDIHVIHYRQTDLSGQAQSIDRHANVIPVTFLARHACHNQSMNFTRIVLVIVAALLLPGGIILLVPLLLKWSRQRKIIPAESTEIRS